MRLLLCSQYFWPENFVINGIVAALSKEGVQVTVLTGKPNYPVGKIYAGYRIGGVQCEMYSGAEVIRIPLLPRGKGSGIRLALNYLSFIVSGCFSAPWVLRGREFDAIFVYAPSPLLQVLPALLLARLKRTPLVIWVQDLWPEALAASGHVKNRWILKGVEAIVRFIYRHADSVLIQSEAFYPAVARLLDDTAKIRHYPNTYFFPEDVDRDENVPLTAELREGFSFVFAGNIGVFQSLETILDAAEQLLVQPEIRIFIVGSGSRSDWLAEEVKRRNLSNVVLAGRLPYSSMPAVFAAASALLVSLGDMPGISLTIPNKLQAYLAAGKPIVASDNGECARVVREAKAGLACSAGDGQGLAAAMLELYRLTPEEWNQFGENGRNYFNANFEPKSRLKELIGHFRDIAKCVREGIK